MIARCYRPLQLPLPLPLEHASPKDWTFALAGFRARFLLWLALVRLSRSLFPGVSLAWAEILRLFGRAHRQRQRQREKAALIERLNLGPANGRQSEASWLSWPQSSQATNVDGCWLLACLVRSLASSLVGRQ